MSAPLQLTYGRRLVGKIKDDKGTINGGRHAVGYGSDGRKYRISISAGPQVLLAGGRYGRKYGTQWQAHIAEAKNGAWEFVGVVRRDYSMRSLLP